MSMFERREVFGRVIHWISTITVMGFMLLVTGCLVDSNDSRSPEFQINTPMVLDISGRWDIHLDQDTSFTYETSFSQDLNATSQNDSLQVLERTSFQIMARKYERNRLAISLTASILGTIQNGKSYPIKNEIGSDELDQIINNRQAFVQLSTTYSKLQNIGDEDEQRLILNFKADSGDMKINRFDGQRLKAKINAVANLIDGQKLIYVNSDSVTVTNFEFDTNAVEIESLIDIPIGRIKNNQQNQRP